MTQRGLAGMIMLADLGADRSLKWSGRSGGRETLRTPPVVPPARIAPVGSSLERTSGKLQRAIDLLVQPIDDARRRPLGVPKSPLEGHVVIIGIARSRDRRHVRRAREPFRAG